MPAMPKEKTSPFATIAVPDLKMKEQSPTAAAVAIMQQQQRASNDVCGCGQQSATNANQIYAKNNKISNSTTSSSATVTTSTGNAANTTKSNASSTPATRTPPKKTANDFIFGKYIGEGSFSTVYLGFEVATNKEYAIKVCEKLHIIREKKQQYIRREREVMHILNNVPGFVTLNCTFQDARSLYFVMTMAKNGDLLPYINKVGSFDRECAQFYAAELLLACEHLDRRGVIHRDLKPENILLDENMHTLVADFGSAKILSDNEATLEESAVPRPASQPAGSGGEESGNSSSDDNGYHSNQRHRRASFVGTAQYVSPEVLQNQDVSRTTDLWALGCIIYQMISGLPPFRGRTDYFIFKEILSGKVEFPEGFDKDAEDLVRSLLKLNPEERLGADDPCGLYESIRSHPFFDGIDWENIRSQTPPQIYPYLPAVSHENELDSHFRLPKNLEPGLDDRQITRLLGFELGTSLGLDGNLLLEDKIMAMEDKSYCNLSEKEKHKYLKNTQKSDIWHKFAENEVIVKKGFINKRKGLFARKRMLLLTTGPRLIYIDPVNMVKKGEIPWSPELRVETKNFKIFFVHTPNRTYYLEDPEGYALEWVDAIDTARRETYGDQS